MPGNTKKKTKTEKETAAILKMLGLRDWRDLLSVTSTYTTMSNRFYMGTFVAPERDKLEAERKNYAVFREWYYNRMYDEKYLGIPFPDSTKKLKEFIRSKLGRGVKDYYITSIQSCVSGMISSQEELLKLHSEEHEIRQQARMEKISSLEKVLDDKKAVKSLLIALSRSKTKGTRRPSASEFEKYGISVYGGSDGQTILGYRKGKRYVMEDAYHYECRLDHEIRSLKARIGHIRDKLNRGSVKKFDRPKRITFGGKGLYRRKDTVPMTDSERQAWANERERKRTNRINYSGRHTSAGGNFQMHYDPDAATIKLDMMDGSSILLKNVSFPYRGEELADYIRNRKGSVGYSFLFKTDSSGHDYFVIAATITQTKTRVNSYYGDGCIAFDTNYDHIAWAELDGQGNCIRTGVFRYKLEGLNSKEREAEIAKAVKKLILLCMETNKPLAMENLEFTKKKAQLGYAGKAYNRMLSLFAYRTVTRLAESWCFRKDILLWKVWAGYTSLIGKVKYMKPLGISIHESAAYTIGRRAMGFAEKVPRYLKPFVKESAVKQSQKWGAVSKALSSGKPAKTHDFYTRFKEDPVFAM